MFFRKRAPAAPSPGARAMPCWRRSKAVRGPFAVINADDFYGAAGYQTLAAHFATSADYAMVGYPLKQTLSEFGTVSRGLCATDAAGRLQSITEITKIEQAAGGARYTDAAGAVKNLSGAEIVSMNFWGFTTAGVPAAGNDVRGFPGEACRRAEGGVLFADGTQHPERTRGGARGSAPVQRCLVRHYVSRGSGGVAGGDRCTHSGRAVFCPVVGVRVFSTA
jgi:hypothetical protein